MKNFNREAIKRMFDGRTGGGGVGSNGADLAGYATQMWVNQNYVSIEFFNRLFSIHGHDPEDESTPPTDISVLPNDMDSIVDSIESMVGFWTEEYLSALGLNSEQGGGGITLNAALASINNSPLGNPTGTNTVLMFNGTTWVYASMGSTDMNTVWNALADGTDTHQINVSHLTTALSGYATTSQLSDYATVTDLEQLASYFNTLSGYFTNGAANEAVKLETARTIWGQQFDGTANITGDITQATCLEFSGIAGTATNGGFIDFHYAGGGADYTSRIIEDVSGVLKINNTIWAQLSGNVSIGTSTISQTYKLDVAGYTKTTRLYLADGVYLEYDSTNSGVHLVGAGFYSDSYVSALGVNSGGGGGGSDYIPLTGSSSITGTLAPSVATADLGSSTNKWRNIYGTSLSISNTLTTYALTVNSSATVVGSITATNGNLVASTGYVSSAGGYKVTGKDDTYVLLAGGGTALLSSIGGGDVSSISLNGGTPIEPTSGVVSLTGIVTKVKIGSSSTEYTPSAYGTLTLPAYPSGFVTGISVNGGTPTEPTGGIVGLTGLALQQSTNDLIVYTDEFDFVPYDFSGSSIHINWRGKGGTLTSTNGVQYFHFLNGKNSNANINYYAKVVAKGFVIKGGTSTQYLLADGSYGDTNDLALASDLSDYLPLTGGTLTGKLTVQAPFFAWNHYQGGTSHPNVASIIFDKAGNNYTGIGGHTTNDVIYFGAVSDQNGTWIDTYKQIWQFNGNVKVQNLTLGQDSGGEFTITTASSDDDIKITANKLTLQGIGDSSGSGGTFLPKGAKFQNVCIECKSDGTYELGRGNEINVFGGPLYLQYNNSKDLYLCTGTNGGNVGIGQQNPTAKLHVGGNAKISNALDAYTITAGSSISSPTYTATAGGYAVTGKDDTYVLLAGGGTSLITSLISSNYVTISTAQTITALKTLTGGLKVSGRVYGSGDDEGIVIDFYNNSIAALCLGTYNGVRSYFYVTTNGSIAWRYGTSNSYADIKHPKKNGTIAIKEDLGTMAYESASDYALASDLSDYAKQRSTNDLIVYSNEFDFVPSDYSYGMVYFNWRGKSGTLTSTNGIQSYHFLNGKNSDGNINYYAKIVAKAFQIKDGSSSGFLKADGSVDSNTYLTSGDVVTTNTAQSIGGAKTFTATLTSSAGGSFTGGLRFYSLCVECTSDGTPSSSRYGEINRYNNGDLHLQYDSGTGNITMLRQNLTVSLDSYNNVNVVKFSTANNRGIYFYTSGSSPIYGTSGWNNVSDVRMKNIVSYVNVDVERIANAPVFNFTFKNSETKNVLLGTSAQYWMTVLPNAVTVAPNNYLSMDYGATALAAAVITARKVVDHEARIRLLEVENAALRNEINQLKKVA